MKRKIAYILITSALILSAFLIGKKQNNSNYYSLTTAVISVDYNTDTVEVEDCNGNIWAFTGCEDWQVEDTCSLIMSDKGTQNIHDDEIISAKYSAFKLNKNNKN